ncbi:MAG: hypothetical protein ACOX20_12210 [Limnochordia bacterium]|jgi:predicted negative regulator of RcsB-dependent stress response|nr:hypothetical protein [Bacillota bacterium]
MERERRIEEIMQFIDENRESYASLAVCRRALERGLAAVDNEAIQRLEQRLQTIPEDELEAYYYIIK